MQGILGINPKKPIINIQKSADEQELHIYIGFAFFESIPNDRRSFQFRYFVARMAKSGFSLVAIAEAFGITEKTVRRYRTILTTSQTEQELFERLLGFHNKKTKLTPEVEAFVQTRFRELYPINRKNYNTQLRDEIHQIFGTVLSCEALRRLIAPIRNELDRQPLAVKNIEVTTPEQVVHPKTRTNTETDKAELINNIFREDTAIDAEPLQADNGLNFFQCAGLLIVNLWLQKFVNQIKVEVAPLLQWLYQLLSGVVNFEQARYFPRHELEIFTGLKAYSVTQSRHLLSAMAYKDFDSYVQALFDANLHFVTMPHFKKNSCYFYIDGHFDPYVGKLAILKGWCAIKNRLMKGTNHYILHNDQGYPVIVELKDCLDSFRYTIKNIIPRVKSFVSHIPGAHVGLIYDRGGFSEELFKEHDRSKSLFITWEVDFEVTDEDELHFDGQLTRYQEKNDIGNFREISIDFLETTYEFIDGFQCRKFIIKRPEGHEYKYSSILTNDWQNDGQTIITYILKRWTCQENDFKYEKAHFGLDEITSYAYEQPSIKDRIQQEKGKIHALEKQLETLKQKRIELLQPLGIKILTKKRIELVQNHATKQGTITKELKLIQEYQQLKLKIVNYRNRLNKKQKALKRKQDIEKNGYIRLDLRKKQILDQLKIIARNIFYNSVDEFKIYYKNLRDLHVVLRHLIQTPGFITFYNNEVHVSLCCTFNGQARKAVELFIDYLNKKSIKMLDGSNRLIQFKLQN